MSLIWLTALVLVPVALMAAHGARMRPQRVAVRAKR